MVTVTVMGGTLERDVVMAVMSQDGTAIGKEGMQGYVEHMKD